MTEQTLMVGRWRSPYRPSERGPSPAAAGLCALAIGNAGAVLWLWLHGGALPLATVSPGGLLLSLGRLKALVGTYLILIQVVMMALLVYAGVLLAFFHQVQTGNEFAAHPVQRGYWDALYILVVLLLLRYRLLAPVLRFWRHRLHVVEVRRESSRVVLIYMKGRELERLGGRGGQFFLWRFLTKSRWWQAHPFSLSAAPDGSALRITVKDLGDFTKLIGEIKPGTRVLADGPYGRTFAPVAGGRAVALIAGGIGITPLRAMLDELIAREEPVTLIHRVLEEEELVLRSELAGYERDGRLVVINVVGDRSQPGAERLLSSEHLLELIPDLPDREIFLCGPPGMMRHVHGSLAALRVPARQVHSERFALAAERTRAPARHPVDAGDG